MILIYAHDQSRGGTGFIINKPLGRFLHEFSSIEPADPIADIPLFYGGPFKPQSLLIVAWQWLSDLEVFKLHFGITEERAKQLKRTYDNLFFQGFLGYSGWTTGQLEEELKKDTWAVSGLDKSFSPEVNPDHLWRQLLLSARPDWIFMVDLPDDFGHN